MSLKNYFKRKVAIGLVGLTALGFGSFLDRFLSERTADVSSPQPDMTEIQQMGTHFNFSQLDKKTAAKVKEYLGILKELPEMADVFSNLPNNLRFVISEDTPGVASFSEDERCICLTPKLAQSPAPEVLVTLAHELRHANQACEGLYFNSNKNLTFAEVFRVAKLMETETKLQNVLIERALRQKGLSMEPRTVACEAFDNWADEFGEDEARDRFVKACWQFSIDADLPPHIKEMFLSHYSFYNFQGFHHAHLMHNPRFSFFSGSSQGGLSAKKIADTYARRMKVSFDGNFFLTNQDNVDVHEDDMSVDFVFSDGSKDRLELDKDNLLIDHLTSYNAEGQLLCERRFYKGNPISADFYDEAGAKSSARPSSRVSEAPNVDHSSSSAAASTVISAEKKASIDLLVGIEFNMDLKEISQIVQKYPNSVNYQGVLEDTPMMSAVRNGREDVIQFLLSKNANLLLVDGDNHSVLNYLDEYGSKLQPETQKTIRKTYAAQEKALSKKGRAL